jgi:hypothetical protein
MGSPDGAALSPVASPAGASVVAAASDDGAELSAAEVEDDDPSELLAQPDTISPAAAIMATAMVLIRERLLIEVLLLKVREATVRSAHAAADCENRFGSPVDATACVGNSHLWMFRRIAMDPPSFDDPASSRSSGLVKTLAMIVTITI